MCLMVLGLAGVATLGRAQTDTGAILGTVKDPTEATVAGAEVVATHVQTNFTRSAMTATDGSYRIMSLPLGAYRLEVKAAGFKKYTRTEITLDLGRNARIDPKLEIGDQVEL
jgi:hypothetical protein